MPTRPTVTAAFATDATITSGPQAGLSTRLDPGAGARAQGFYQDRRLPARALSYLLGIAGDWIGYLDSIASVFDLGGVLNPAAPVTISSTLTASGTGGFFVTHDELVSGKLTVVQQIVSNSYVRGAKRVAVGSLAVGVTTYRMDTYEHVFNEGSAVGGGVIWKIDLTGANSQECMRFYYNNASFAVFIQDPSGSTIATLQQTSGSAIAVTVLNNAGTCVVIDRTLHP